MKVKWQHLYISWGVLSLGLLSCAADTYDSKFARRKKLFKLSTSKSKPSRLSTTGDRKSNHSSPPSTSPLFPLSSQRPYPPAPPVTRRSMRPGKAEAKIQSDFSQLTDVSVTCSISGIVVRVKPGFYGLGADAEELKLGSSCKSNGVLRPYGDLLFTYPLTACDAVRELHHGHLVYKFVLHYAPSQNRFPSRAHRMDVDVECRYQRNHHVYQLAVKPTWQTPVLRKRLKGRPSEFNIDLMDDSWSGPAKFRVYQLGKTVNFQVSAPHLATGGKLYVSGCYAAPSVGIKSPLKYTIIDNFGCMLDSKSDPGASQFISRTDNTLRFSLKAFQFTADPDTEISIHCKVAVTSDDPDPAHKSCTYRGNRWKALTGDDSICECCDSQCVTSKPRRALIEGSASSGSLLVSDQSYTAEDVSMSREDEIITNQYTDENLWRSTDVVNYNGGKEGQGYKEKALEESRVTLGVMTQPDLNKLGFRDGVDEQKKVSSNKFAEDGSGSEVDDFVESEKQESSKGQGGEIADVEQVINLNQKNSEVIHHRVQSEQLRATQQSVLQLFDSKDEEENGNYTVGGEEDERRLSEWKNDDLASVADDGEVTWYFMWR